VSPNLGGNTVCPGDTCPPAVGKVVFSPGGGV